MIRFSILDFGFWIAERTVARSRLKAPMQLLSSPGSLIQNPKSKIQNRKRTNGNYSQGHSVRHTDDDQEPGVHRGGSALTRAGHRRQYVDLQHREHAVAQTAAVQRSGQAGAGVSPD